jgi:hypothetical protein
VPHDVPWEIELRVAGLPAGDHDLFINDGPPTRLVVADAKPVTVRLRVEGRSIVLAEAK